MKPPPHTTLHAKCSVACDLTHQEWMCLCTIYRLTFNMVKCQTANPFIVSPPRHPPSQTKTDWTAHSMQEVRDSILCKFHYFQWFTFSKRPDSPSHLLTPILNKLPPPTSPSSQTSTHQRHLSQPRRLQKRLGSGCLCKFLPILPKGHFKNLTAWILLQCHSPELDRSMRGVFQQSISI